MNDNTTRMGLNAKRQTDGWLFQRYSGRASRCLGTVLTFLAVVGVLGRVDSSHAAEGKWQAGVAKVTITPEEPMWMSGYGGRTKPAEGQVHDLYARAAALRDPAGKTAVFVATDLVGVPVKMSQHVSRLMAEKHGLERSELMITCSHTHCGPALDHKLSYMLAMDDDDWAHVRKYQKTLNDKVVRVIDEALNDLGPAKISFGIGTCGFASNRRRPIGLGPYDHDVPVLRIDSADGSQLRGVIFGYACHNTTLSFYQWCGDYAGFAQLDLEDRHPNAVAMFFTGCGADQNPLPRRKLELARKYGRMLAVSVDEVLDESMQPVRGYLKTEFREIPLEFESVPSREELLEQANSDSRYARARAELLLSELQDGGELSETYPYPVQVWLLGNRLTWVALGGEVVVKYALRLKQEIKRSTTWVTGYANDVMAYIPSELVLEQGGYEGDTSMVVYQMPSKWQAGLEDRIVETVHQMIHEMKDWKPLFDGKSLENWTETRFGGEGDASVQDGAIRLETGVTLTGIRYTNEKELPRSNYEVTLEAQRVLGSDFFCGLTFPVKDDPCSLIVGGWGGGVCGLSSIDGLDASENETTTYRSFETGRWYRITLRVTDSHITAWIDDEMILDQKIIGREISIRPEVELSKPFGIASWQTTAALRDIRIRRLGP